MRLPRKFLYIGNHKFTIKHAKQIKKDGSDCLGYCLTDDNLIMIQYGLKKTVKEVTLFHEAIHAISNIYELNLTERQVGVLGEVLPNFLQKNNIC